MSDDSVEKACREWLYAQVTATKDEPQMPVSADCLAAFVREQRAERDQKWWDALAGVPGVDCTPEAVKQWVLQMIEQAKHEGEQAVVAKLLTEAGLVSFLVATGRKLPEEMLAIGRREGASEMRERASSLMATHDVVWSAGGSIFVWIPSEERSILQRLRADAIRALPDEEKAKS